MEIRVIEEQPALVRMTPQELAADRKTLPVMLSKPITLEIEGKATVTYPIGQSFAPCSIVNVLVAAGAELIGSSLPRDAEKKSDRVKGMPTYTRGGLAGCVRFNI
jgi:hypothetical protein